MHKRHIDWLPLSRPQLGTWPATQACALTWNHTSSRDMQASTQSTEPHQPGMTLFVAVLSLNFVTHKIESM